MKKILFFAVLALVLTACKPEAVIPADSTPVKEQALIYPDYRDIVVPPNIAPLNIMVKSPGTEFVGRIASPDGSKEILAAADEDGKLFFDSVEWKGLLQSCRGKDLNVTIYSHQESGWMKHPDYKITVANEEIDPYLTYRLIEPSYELYRQLGIYQRNLTSFEEVPIYENNADFEAENNHCINCHAAQAYGATHRTLFHVRGEHGGTVFAHDGKVERMNMKNDSTLGNAVYPAWHPTKPWIVFSSNKTGQTFHMTNTDKIEVVDYGSDLIFYDVEKNLISNVLKTPVEMETFPAWAPDGKRLYYCSAYLPAMAQISDTLKGKQYDDAASDTIITNYQNVHYNLMSLDFDPDTKTWGKPQLVLDCAALGLSATVPRVSSDGRWLLITLGKFGQFHIWHKQSDLYVLDLEAIANGTPAVSAIRRLDNANSDNVESFHNWSSNGRWMVFSSRRDDGSYTRPYIAYFDKDGHDYKAFVIPQEDPELNLLRMKSYNVPELSTTAVDVTPQDFRDAIYVDDENVRKVQYGK